MTADPEIDAAFLERFNLTLSRAGGPSQLRRATSFSLTAIDNYRTGASEPSRSRLLEIAKAANVSAAWLTTGEGPMEPGGESPLVVAGSERMEGYALVPKYAVQASAGTGSAITSELIVDHLAFRTAWLQGLGIAPGNLLLIEAAGDSMTPRIADGDLLLIDTSLATVRQNAIYVIRIDGDLVVKRVQRKLDGDLVVISDNPAYPPESVPAGEASDLAVIGRVIWIGGRV